MESLPDAGRYFIYPCLLLVENAVKLLSKKEINGRPINVEIAKPRDETAQNEKKDAQPSRGGFRGITFVTSTLICIRPRKR